MSVKPDQTTDAAPGHVALSPMAFGRRAACRHRVRAARPPVQHGCTRRAWGAVGGRFATITWALLLAACLNTPVRACDLATETGVATDRDIRAFFAARNKQVITFVGYSGSGYEDRPAMLAKAADVLAQFDPAHTIVNIGATPDGIGAVYELAKRRGFLTTGIVSTQAMRYDAALSPCVDRVFYVQDETWGGYLDDGQTLSPTSETMVENSDVLIGIGGGSVARDELHAASRAGKAVRYFPADMDHERATEKARENGLPIPDSFAGAAAEQLAPDESQ